MPVKKITIEQFAQKVKAKYPQYKDVNDSVLVEKIIAKHPEYKERVNTDQVPAAQPEPQAFQVKISEPTFKPQSQDRLFSDSQLSMDGTKVEAAPSQTPIRTFTDQKPVDDYGLAKLKNKATEAKTKLDLELHANDGQYEKKIREIRRDSFTMDDLKKEAKEKGYIIPVGQENEVLKLAKQRQYDLPINSDEISDIKTGTIINPEFSRQFIKDLNSPEAQKQAYYVDAYNHAADDPDGLSRAQKIKENAEKIGKKEYVYDPVNRLLGKPEGFLNSVISGRHDLNNSFDLYHYIKDAPDNAVIDRLNKELVGDIDEPVAIPEGTIAGVGRMMGSQPLKGLLAGGIAAVGTTATGHPEHASTAFNLANAGVSAVDMYKIGFANSVKANYALFKQQGLSDNEALQRAKVLGENQANTDAASAALMSFAAGKMAFKPTGIGLSTLKKPLMSALGQIGQASAKKALEGLGIGAIGGAAQIIKNVQAQNAGLPVGSTEGFKEQVEAGIMLTVATHVIAKAATSLKPSTLNKLTNAISKVPKEAIDNSLATQEQSGHITPEEAKQAHEIIQQAVATEESVPRDIPETDRQRIISNIKERNDLKNQLETVDEFKHPEIKEKIKKLNEDSLAILHGSERGDLQKLVNKEINDGNVHGFATDPLRNATEKELEGYMKDIADQAHDPATEAATIEAYGEEIVKKAKELYPLIKPEENAIPERIPETAHVGEAPGNSEAVGGGIPEPGQAAGTQETGGQSQESSSKGKEGIGPMEGGIPPNMFDLPFTPEEGDVGRLAHADTEKIYRDLGMTDRIPRATKNDISLESEADNLIRNGYDFEGKADRVLSGREKSFTDTEQVAFAKMVGALNVKLQNLEVNTPEFNATLDTIERLSRASDKAGSEQGAALRARRMFVLNDETLSSFMQRAKDANLDVPLTEKQAAEVKARFDDLVASRDAYRARLEAEAAKNRGVKAERNIKKVKSETKAAAKRTHEDYVKERQDIITKMREDLLKVAKGGGGAMSSIPGAAQLIAAAPHVAKLVKSVIDEGVQNLPDIIKNVHDQIKDAIPGITEKNVHDIIAGEYSKKNTKTELQEKLAQVRMQAGLINRLEAMKSGVQPKSERSQRIRNAEIESLRKQIHELRADNEQSEADLADASIKRLEKELADLQQGVVKEGREKRSVTEREKELKDEIFEAKKNLGLIKSRETKIQSNENSKLNSLKARYKKQTEEIQKKIDSGDFEPDEISEIDLDNEARNLKDEYIKKKIEWQKYIAQEAFNNRTNAQKIRDKVTEVLNIPRTVMASADLSAPLRQGLVMTVSHPMVASKAFVESLRQVISPARFDRWLYDLKESNYYKDVISKAGLYVADPNNLHLSAKEEAFMTNLAEKIPVIGKVIAGSERAYVAYLNKMRVDIFTMYAKELTNYEKGVTPETRPDLYEGLAAFVNAATGRGELGDLEPAAQVLNSVFFSPRLIASRINMLNPIWYASLPKEVRIMALKDMAKMIGLGATTVGLFSLVPGSKTETNPNSPDFGKIHVGNTRWDIWGGFQQYIRLASQLFSGYEKKSNGNIVPLGTKFNEQTRADKLISFFRGKLAPVPSMTADVLSGKTATGEDVTLKDEAREHLIPMIGNDVADAWKEQGPASMLFTGLPSFLGVGTTTYEQKSSSSKKHHHTKQYKKNKKQ